MFLKLGAGKPTARSACGVEFMPGSGVSARPHRHAGELFYIPANSACSPSSRQLAPSATGAAGSWPSARVSHGGPGLHPVRRGRLPGRLRRSRDHAGPHALSRPERQRYREEPGELIRQPAQPDPAATAHLRARHDIR